MFKQRAQSVQDEMTALKKKHKKELDAADANLQSAVAAHEASKEEHILYKDDKIIEMSKQESSLRAAHKLQASS